jgi:hypothetical protein
MLSPRPPGRNIKDTTKGAVDANGETLVPRPWKSLKLGVGVLDEQGGSLSGSSKYALQHGRENVYNFFPRPAETKRPRRT